MKESRIQRWMTKFMMKTQQPIYAFQWEKAFTLLSATTAFQRALAAALLFQLFRLCCYCFWAITIVGVHRSDSIEPWNINYTNWAAAEDTDCGNHSQLRESLLPQTLQNSSLLFLFSRSFLHDIWNWKDGKAKSWICGWKDYGKNGSLWNRYHMFLFDTLLPALQCCL